MDIEGAIKSLPRPPSIAFFILLLRVSLLFFASINLCALTAAFQLYPSDDGVNLDDTTDKNILSSDHYRYYFYNFDDTPQMVVNLCLFVAGIYSFLGNSQWSRRLRLATGSVLVLADVVLIGGQFRKMAANGGCDTGKAYNYKSAQAPDDPDYVTPLKRRCWIQLVVGSIGAVWALLLVIELVLTNIQRKRESHQKLQTHQRAYEEFTRQQELCSVVHYYQPDGSTQGAAAGTGPSGAAPSRASLELDPLPAYQQRHSGPRPVIVDLANMGMEYSQAVAATATAAHEAQQQSKPE
ncbi:hypothetical protein BGX31_000820 [Mortierella sp. GBA43]|nr:hypothetical protein BGX31_000820 [Mortierella sp. GBA43]